MITPEAEELVYSSANLPAGFLSVQILFPQLGVGGLNKKAVRGVRFLPSLLRFSKPKKLRFEDQIEVFPYSFPGLTFGKIFTPLWIPKEFP